jgi:hypothetical protein
MFAFVLCLDHRAQGFEHGRQIGLELLDSLAKVGNLGALKAKEELQQLFELLHIGHVAAHHLCAVLNQHGLRGVFEDDVVLRIAALELEGDLLVEVVLCVLGLPIAEGHAQLVHQRAIDCADVLGGAVEPVLGDEDQALLVAPVFEQPLEGLAHTALAVAATDLLDPVELGKVLVDQDLTHGA